MSEPFIPEPLTDDEREALFSLISQMLDREGRPWVLMVGNTTLAGTDRVDTVSNLMPDNMRSFLRYCAFAIRPLERRDDR